MSDQAWTGPSYAATVIGITFGTGFLQRAVDAYSELLPEAQLAETRKCLVNTTLVLSILKAADEQAILKYGDRSCKTIEQLKADHQNLVTRYKRNLDEWKDTNFLIKRLIYVSTLAGEVRQVLRDADQHSRNTTASSRIALKHREGQQPDDQASLSSLYELLPDMSFSELQSDLEMDLAEMGLDEI